MFQCFSGHWMANLIRITKMYLKQSFSYSKSVLPSILFLTVLSNSVSVSSDFDTAFLPGCTKFCSVSPGYWIGNLMKIPKMCIKQSFFYSKTVLPAILSLTVLSNCVSDFQTLTPLFSLTLSNFVEFFRVIGQEI